MISLAGKAALVTGGSRGIGAATVKMFAQAGADVVFSYHRNRESAAQVEQEARKHGTRIESFKADLGKMVDAKKLVAFAHQRLGRLDILIANAGIWNHEDAPIEKISEREWDEMIRVNLKSVYAAVHHAVPHMIAQGGGRIVTLGSVAGQRGTAFHAHYSATKGAIISFTKALAVELARHNILVNCVAPGFVDTGIWKATAKNRGQMQKLLAAYPLNRVATVEEVAGPILFAVSDLATYVTGEVINVNGGSFPCG
ncbi:MAG TPA: SDR family NAD(P)-dependent oxidoreductase [Candidatus Acidoferrales bacterium]|nr:SDR family NAD(P)-dependent oxidoreductase [Candidatus Acidoferrales bacterium]